MLNDWDFLRYRGDYQDEKNLRESYQVDHYSEGYQEHLLARAQVVEQQILSQGVRLDAGLSPRFSGLNEEIRKALEIELPVQCYCLPDQTIHAVAIWSEHTAGRVAVFALTAGALRIPLIPAAQSRRFRPPDPRDFGHPSERSDAGISFLAFSP